MKNLDRFVVEMLDNGAEINVLFCRRGGSIRASVRADDGRFMCVGTDTAVTATVALKRAVKRALADG